MGEQLILCNPVGIVSLSAKRATPLAWTPGARVGLLFNNHVSSYRVWTRLEALVEERLGASRLTRVWKENTFAEAPRGAVGELAASSDVALVGVAA